MARGVMMTAETREDAERQVVQESADMRVLRCREIDLTDLPPLASGPLPRHWVVVVEHCDPEREASLPQHEDPEEHCERETRLLYLTMSVDPMLLVTATIERFACPSCGATVEVHLPPRITREHNASCSACNTPVTRASNGRWELIPIVDNDPQPCIFCGVIDGSHEHVIPHWVSKQLGIKDFLAANDALTSPRRARRKQPISVASHRSQCFCDGCNTHFKGLEDAAMPLLVAMARGRTFSIGTDSQELIGLWAAKTAIAIVAADRDLQPAIPSEHPRAVRSGQIPEHTWIFVLRWHGEPLLANAAFLPDGRSERHAGYAALLAFGEFAMFVVGTDGIVTIDVRPIAIVPSLRQVWPPAQQFVDWPPAAAADRTILATLARIGRPVQAKPPPARQSPRAAGRD